MRKLNGLFPLEPTVGKENTFLEDLCPQGQLEYMLSGRCGIYHCLLDILKHDRKKTAYLPLYTCETVVAPFAKAGFRLKFYPFDRNMAPVFDDKMLDEISLISVCGYFGFSNYDRGFVKKCRERGITVIEDMTHSLFSKDGLDENWDYACGSFRKWMGVACGGFAMKRKGLFEERPMAPHAEHLKLRYDAIEKDSHGLFWEGEMLLRRIFDDYGSDERSRYIIKHADIDFICKKRRENYRVMLDSLKENENLRVVFPFLDENTVPSHFTIFVNGREKLQSRLNSLDIKNSVFWPVGPYIRLEGHDGARYIYDHVISLPCDQRYSGESLKRIASAVNGYFSA